MRLSLRRVCKLGWVSYSLFSPLHRPYLPWSIRRTRESPWKEKNRQHVGRQRFEEAARPAPRYVEYIGIPMEGTSHGRCDRRSGLLLH